MELAEVKRERVEIEVNRGPRVEFEQMQVQVTPDSFHIDAAKGDLKYAIEGKRDGGKSAPTSIAIATGKAKNVYKSLSEVPEEHRPAVQQLLGSIR